MASNSFGKFFTLTTFGESHGDCVGGVIDGVPSNFILNLNLINEEFKKLVPDYKTFFTKRKETNLPIFLSGIKNSKTLGSPIAFTIKNDDYKSKDYNELEDVFRPSHADYTYLKKYGIRDANGGGRASARALAPIVVAGSIAKQFLKSLNIEINAYTSQIADIKLDKHYSKLDINNKNNNPVVCPDDKKANEMEKHLEDISVKGDSTGGVVSCIIKNVTVGLGDPLFEKLNANLAKAMFSINAVRGFEIGSGFKGTEKNGSTQNDNFIINNNKIKTSTNNSGGIQGGISNGEDIYFNVGFKPVSSIGKEQKTISVEKKSVNIKIKGRHDACCVPRAVPIVEAMAAMVMFDSFLQCNALNIHE